MHIFLLSGLDGHFLVSQSDCALRGVCASSRDTVRETFEMAVARHWRTSFPNSSLESGCGRTASFCLHHESDRQRLLSTTRSCRTRHVFLLSGARHGYFVVSRSWSPSEVLRSRVYTDARDKSNGVDYSERLEVSLNSVRTSSKGRGRQLRRSDLHHDLRRVCSRHRRNRTSDHSCVTIANYESFASGRACSRLSRAMLGTRHPCSL